MRIWDISPGYLNDKSLLGEHRELHGIVSIIVNGKKGYSKHPETIRWLNHSWGISQRHKQLSCEMKLRGFNDKTPVDCVSNKGNWPKIFIDTPSNQYEILKKKYIDKEQGRIPLPLNTQVLWSQHKYSIMARNQNLYREIGRDVAKNDIQFEELSMLLTDNLRIEPKEGDLRNAIQHMWGYVSDNSSENFNVNEKSLLELLKEIQIRAYKREEKYLLASTALSDFMVWLV